MLTADLEALPSRLKEIAAQCLDNHVILGGLELHDFAEKLPAILTAIRAAEAALDTIPALLMLAGGPPYNVTFTPGALNQVKMAQEALAALGEGPREGKS